MRLDEHDLRALLAWVGEMTAPAHEEFADAVFAGLRRLVPCDVVVYDEIDLRSGASTARSDPPEAAERVNAAWERVMHEHPGLAHAAREGDETAHSLSEFLTRRNLQRLELYEDVYRPMEVEDELGAIIRVDGKLMIAVAVSRRGRDFSDRERALVEAARPWLARGYRSAVATARRREVVDALERALDDAGQGLAHVRSNGQVGHVTPQAARLFARYLGTRRPRLADAPTHVEGHGGRLRFRPIGDGWFIVEDDPDRLAGRGLSTREREVLERATRGETNQEIAAALFITPGTVGKHLEHAYGKLGVHGRREAAHLIAGTPPAEYAEGPPRGSPSHSK